MGTESTPEANENATLQATQVYILAVICLSVGLIIGYLFRGAKTGSSQIQTTVGTQSSLSNSTAANGTATSPHQGMMTTNGHMPSQAELKEMADKQIAELNEKLKKDPNNSVLIAQLGGIYHSMHEYKQAITEYSKAVELDPKNVIFHTKLASSLFRNGDADGAIAQLNLALAIDPKDANSLFDLGLIKFQTKHDSRAAVATWQQLLKSNPQLSEDRKTMVVQLITKAQAKPSAKQQSARSTVQ